MKVSGITFKWQLSHPMGNFQIATYTIRRSSKKYYVKKIAIKYYIKKKNSLKKQVGRKTKKVQIL